MEIRRLRCSSVEARKGKAAEHRRTPKQLCRNRSRGLSSVVGRHVSENFMIQGDAFIDVWLNLVKPILRTLRPYTVESLDCYLVKSPGGIYVHRPGTPCDPGSHHVA